MLRGIRTASTNWLGRIVLGVLLGLIAISFAVWGIGDIFRGFGQASLARIGGTEITTDQFRQLYTERLQQMGRQLGRPVTMEQARALGIDRQLVGQLIAEATLDQRVKALRLSISDTEMARRLMADPTLRGPDGRFDRRRLEMLLREAQTTEQRYIGDQRRQMLRRQLAGTILEGTAVPKSLLEAADRYQNEQRAIEFVLLTQAQAGEIPEPTPEVLAKFYESRKGMFRTPEYRKIVVLALLPEERAKQIEISEADLKKAYQDRRARYLTPERRTVQQIRFDDPLEAKKASERIANGADFLEIAKEQKQSEKDIELGTLPQGAFVDKAVGEAAFALKENEVSGPVIGRFGTMLLRVLKIEPESARPFEEVAADLKRELTVERAKTEILPFFDKMEDERSLGRLLPEAAKNLNLPVRTIEVTRDGLDRSGKPVTDLPDARRLLTGTFSTDVGVENDPLQFEGGYIWYEVTDIAPESDRPFDEIKDQVEARWREEEIATRLRAKANELLQRLKLSPLPELAAAEGLKVETRADIKRTSVSPPISPRALDAIFRTPKDGYGSAEAESPTELLVFRVTEVTLPEIDANSEEVKKLRDALNQSYAQDVFGEYLYQLQQQIGVRINENALKQVVTGQRSDLN